MYHYPKRFPAHITCLLKKHGLSCRILQDSAAKNPLDSDDTLSNLQKITVGIHVPPLGLGMPDSGRFYVDKWLQDSSGHSVDDIIYMNVRTKERKSYEASKLDISVVDPTPMPLTGSMQFVYVKKSDVMTHYEVDEINQETVEKVKAAFDAEIKAYEMWCNKEVYFIEVESSGSEVSITRDGVYDSSATNVFEAITELVAEVVAEVDSSPDTATLQYSVDLDQIHEDDDPEIWLTELMNDLYGFTSLVGTSNFDYDENVLTMNVSLSELPIFLHLATYSKQNLFKLMRKNYPEVDMVIDLTEKTPYSSWTDKTLKALFSSIIDDLEVKGWTLTALQRKNIKQR